MPLILLIILTFGVKTNSSIVPLIWGGIPALAGQFSHQAAIRVKNNTLIKCSASILNSRWILTARHCIPNDITNSREVLVGTVITGNGIVYDIEKAVEHPGEGITNDIALVKVKNDIQFSSEVKPIKIENSFIEEGVDVVLSGWGQTEHGETTQLMWTNFTTISNEECHKTYQDIFRTDLCAYHSNRNICYRDSGSSLTKDGKVVGVVSRGYICERRAPGIFVRVSEFQQWIKDQIQPLVMAKSAIVPLIWGGIPALAGQFPHQAAMRLKNEKKLVCSGSILSIRWILTARHCIWDNTTKTSEMLVGTVTTDKGVAYDIEQTVKYPDQSITNDIGLIKVKKDFEFNLEVQPIEIENSFIKEGVDVVLSGWGKTEHGETTHLMWTTFTSISNEACRKTYVSIFRTDLCAYHPNRNICVCDSGSSLMKDGKVIGVVSRGFICEKRAPGVFVRVSEFQQWIRDHIQVTS